MFINVDFSYLDKDNWLVSAGGRIWLRLIGHRTTNN